MHKRAKSVLQEGEKEEWFAFSREKHGIFFSARGESHKSKRITCNRSHTEIRFFRKCTLDPLALANFFTKSEKKGFSRENPLEVSFLSIFSSSSDFRHFCKEFSWCCVRKKGEKEGSEQWTIAQPANWSVRLAGTAIEWLDYLLVLSLPPSALSAAMNLRNLRPKLQQKKLLEEGLITTASLPILDCLQNFLRCPLSKPSRQCIRRNET